MQISTSVGVVQDILISLSFQKNAKLIVDPSRSQDQPAGICVNCPAAELGCNCGVPERVRPMCLTARSLIDKSALIAAGSMRQEGGHHQYFKVAIRRPVHVCPDIPRVSGDTLEIVLILGLNQQPARSGPSGCSLRGCSSSRVPPPGVNSFAPAALFLGIGLFAPPSARAATWQS